MIVLGSVVTNINIFWVSFSPFNDGCTSEELPVINSFRDRAPTSPSREEVKAQAFERLQEELKKAQEVRSSCWLSGNSY